ncbi:MAG: BamA/TamA family outer membrane protein, partial [Gemmatimonadota bacterium]
LSMITNLLSGVMTSSALGLSPILTSARERERIAFVYLENYGTSVFTVDEPRSLTRMAANDLPADAYAPVFLADGPGGEIAADVDGAADAAVGTPDLAAVTDSIEVPDSVAVAAGDVEDAFVNSYYRGDRDDDFRPSEVLPTAPETVEGPVSVLATLDSASYALPDTAAFQFRDYDVKFTPDIVGRPTIGAQVGGYYGNGVYGGSFIALSDMLGNHNILLSGNINGSFSDAMFFGSYGYLRRRANLGVSLLQVPIYRFVNWGPVELPSGDDGLTQVFTRDVVRQAQAMVNYPFSTFRRLELGMQGTFYSRDLLFQGINLSQGGEPVRETENLGSANYYQPSAALVFDNTLFGFTGPVVGRRYRLQLSRTFGDARFYEGLLDFRNYLNFNQSIVLASRLVGLVRTGENANQFPIYWGGPYLLRGYNIDSFDPNSSECRDFPGAELSSCAMRHQLFGSSAALMNLELRFPVVSELQIGFLGRFPPVDGVLFFDGGVAWDEEVCFRQSVENPLDCSGGQAEEVHLVWDREPGQSPIFFREPLFSAGVGLRLNVFFAVLRMDYAWPLSRPERGGVFSLSFGPSF